VGEKAAKYCFYFYSSDIDAIRSRTCIEKNETSIAAIAMLWREPNVIPNRVAN
jgi:hypothetical protein